MFFMEKVNLLSSEFIGIINNILGTVMTFQVTQNKYNLIPYQKPFSFEEFSSSYTICMIGGNYQPPPYSSV